MAIQLKANNANLKFKQGGGQIIQGIDGGYYIPVIDAEGNLTWTPTQADMPAVAASNIMGPEGKQGIPGKDGAKGDTGAPFTYDMFTEEQLAALVGPAGKDGKDGEQGKQGPAGEDGADGKDGAPGKDGEKGESGVYVGTTEPTDDEMLIWINPEGGSSESLATTKYVDEAIAAAIGEIESGSY